jgi:hypothetical protein
MASGFPIRAIVLPQIAHRQETRLKKAPPAASLAALAPSTIFQSAGADRRDFHNLVTFVREVPSYALELGTELPGIRHAVLNLLSRS